ncbi:MAG: F0F1 ATP synthase subunit epsilon [Clostridia bacterium]|nr:F0F1 ATP synthase subunit epsilon [Clostridia bacterium]
MADVVTNKIKLSIVTPYGKFYDGEVDSAVIPVEDGDLGIMAGHSPVIVGLVPGIGHYIVSGETKYFVIAEGYAQVEKNSILIICDSAERPEDIVAYRTVDSYLYFSDLLKSIPNSKELEAGIKRSLVRMKAIERFADQERKDTLKQLKLENNIK